MALTDDFLGLIKKLAADSHGIPTFAKVKEFMASRIKDTAARVEFLHPILTREPISWDEAKDNVPKWDTEKKKLDNKFDFIQGDVLETSRVEGLGSATSSISHTLWIVLSPDCDCVRASLVRVAPVYPVNSGSDTYRDDKNNLQDGTC